MPMQVLINLFIATLWMFLQDEWSVLSFFSGYLVGIFVLFLMRRFFPHNFYISTFINIIKLFIVFIHELFTSSIQVVKQVMRPKLNITPGIFTMDTDLEGELEITLLALLICLTPGSVVVEVSTDSRKFYIHGMDIPTSSDSLMKSKDRFEKSIKRVTRK
ncbi:Na+/H+ antiporter subunit E [Cytobacillus purgationiresistens]|uniref:Multicomponent Na+:H+ antiporter subunit E n=1 Tax=Cytobacillus purgationiresistens TaxID=863449 RepID=A0ABU0AF40_9BACI|nr:Na+/H+ antiporter subunit E [Cytobacillus purgationiresistens]MDQ0269877.1 multicomponent Na+:H+ antiporter subunit E [Cytobacillus purgationiresistens]